MSFWTVANQAGPWVAMAVLGYLKWQSDRKIASLTAEVAKQGADSKDKEVNSHAANETATTRLSIQDKYQELIDEYWKVKKEIAEQSTIVATQGLRILELERKSALDDGQMLILRKRDSDCAEVERENILLRSQNKDLEEQLSLLKIEIAAASMGQAAAEAGLRVAQKMLGGINPALVEDMQAQIDEVRAQARENMKRIDRQEQSPPPFG